MRFLKWFLKAMKGVKQHLIRVSSPSSLTFVGEEMQSGEFYAKMVILINSPYPPSSFRSFRITWSVIFLEHCLLVLVMVCPWSMSPWQQI